MPHSPRRCCQRLQQESIPNVHTEGRISQKFGDHLQTRKTRPCWAPHAIHLAMISAADNKWPLAKFILVSLAPGRRQASARMRSFCSICAEARRRIHRSPLALDLRAILRAPPFSDTLSLQAPFALQRALHELFHEASICRTIKTDCGGA